jgi:hypothetical protein
MLNVSVACTVVINSVNEELVTWNFSETGFSVKV